MSQYPPPYSPYSVPYAPQPYGGYPSPWSNLLTPARRAALVLFILAGVILLFGVCAGVISMFMGSFPPEVQSKFDEMKAQNPQLASESLQSILRIAAVMYLVAALLLAGLGVLVRSGRQVAVIIGIIFVGLAILYFAWQFLILASHAQLPGLAVSGVFLGVLVLVLRWLIQALHNAALLQNAQAQYQMQYQQYQQQAAAWQGTMTPGGYGYGGYLAPPPPVQNGGNPPAPLPDQPL